MRALVQKFGQKPLPGYAQCDCTLGLQVARNETEVLAPAEIHVQLPPDYLCRVVGNGTADPDGNKGFFTPPDCRLDAVRASTRALPFCEF